MSSLQMTARFQPPDGETNMKLSKILGVTSLNNACYTTDNHSNVIYAAGCIAIVYQIQTNKQVDYFKVLRPISSLALTHDGRYLAIGERGHQPTITIWDISTSEKLTTLIGHQHGIGVIKFSLDDECLVSVGFKTDKQLIVWDWREGKQSCSTRLENKVNSIDFHLGGQFFVTCGENHLKWWYMIKESNAEGKPYVKGLNGRLASILDVHRNSTFVDIVCAKSSMNQSISTNIYALSSTGVLCLIHESRLMDKWVQVDTSNAYALAITHSAHVLVGCTNGHILIFSAESLEYLGSLPLPFPLSSDSTKYPACYSLCPVSNHIISTYADRSMFIWDLTDINQPIKLRSFTYHSSCIWDLQFLPTHSSNQSTSGLPEGTFFTCGADNMIHIWNIDPQQQRLSSWKSSSSRDLLHSLCIHQESGASSGEIDLSLSMPDFELPDRQQGGQTARCISLHPDGLELACGSKSGRVHIFDLRSMKPLPRIPKGIKAHEAEILALSYSPMIHEEGKETCFLASGGRDRLIHIYDATPTLADDQSYHLITTLDSHSSSITITHFTSDGKKFISCSGDKTMVLNNITGSEFHRQKSIPTPHGTINGFALDSATNKFAVSTGQDKRINVWNIQSGKLVRSYKPEGLSSEFYKCCVDPSGMFVATCSFDKHIRIYDFFSGELIHQDYGHSELITSVKFSPDGRYLISVGGDGCIMVWTIAEHLVEAMQDRLVELYAIASKKKHAADCQIDSLHLKSIENNVTKESKQPVRTGGLISNATEGVSEGIIGKGLTSSKRPATTGPSTTERQTPTRPLTAGDNSKQALPPRRLPAWAARGLKPSVSATPETPVSSAPIPQSKWAERVSNQDLQILGKPMVNKEKHKLTLELTTSDAPLSSPKNLSDAERLASTLEESDGVLMMDHSRDDQFDSSDDDVIDAEDLEEDRLNQTSTNLDKLEESAEQLESWLERKLREETKVDDSVSLEDISIQETNAPNSVLGASLSSDFFKKIRENPDTLELPPPPQYSPKIESSATSLNSKEALYQKQQETADAVSQMRSRLKAMGILEKTGEPTVSSAPKHLAQPEFFPPPPPFPSDLKAEIDNDTASTVSGGSDLESEVAEDLNESSYLNLLSELDLVSKKALTAYEALLNHKKRCLQTHHSREIDMNSSIPPTSESIEIRPSYSAMSPRIQRDTDTVVDRLLSEFETRFGNIVSTAETLISSSGVHRIPLSQQSSLIGAHQSKIEFDPTGSNVNLHTRSQSDGELFASLRRSVGDDRSDPSVDVSLILEKYSDRLVTLVAEKMIASQNMTNK